MYKIGIFQIFFVKTKSQSGRERTTKKYMYLETISYTNSKEFCVKYNAIIQKYANKNNIIMLEFNEEKQAFITFNTSKKEVLLHPYIGVKQSGGGKVDYTL